MNVTELRAKHPMPWRYILLGNNVQLLDALGRELPMFAMLDFVVVVTHQMASQTAAAQPAT